MKIGLITTLDTNIGDDFIREGILYVLGQVLTGEVEYEMINKHEPNLLYPTWHPVRWAKVVPRRYKRHWLSYLTSRLFSWTGGSVFDDCDAIIQCGAPVYWYGCHKAEWADVFWRGIAKRLSKKIPVLNLAAGSCYPWERIPESVDDARDAEFIRMISAICRKTLVRDEKSYGLLGKLGCPPILLPCSAFLAAMPYHDLEKTNEYIFINYMPGGSHYDFEQHIDAAKWERTIKEFIQQIKGEHRVAFICHNQKEYDAAMAMAMDIECFFPNTVEEYFHLAVRGRAGIFNRMHASVGFAGLGIPSMAIGADTRMLMVDKIGLPVEYVKNVTVELLVKMLDELLEENEVYASRLLALQRETLQAYCSELEQIFN